MKKFYIFLIALFIINGAMAQGSVLALSINALAQSKHPTFRSNEIVRDGMHNTGMKKSNLNSEMNLGKIIKLQAPARTVQFAKLEALGGSTFGH